MSSLSKPVKILETCLVSPPAEYPPAAAEQTLPLTYLDLGWLYFHPIQRLIFYPFPSCSTAHFQETIVPRFKNSLSLTLKHFLPLAGNLIHPPNFKIPLIRYAPGDAISVTVAKADPNSDFNYLIGNNPRDADEFYNFFTALPSPETDPKTGSQVVPLFTAQITLFPDTGICIGFNNNHTVGDASSIVGFIKAWSLISRLESDGEFLSGKHSSLLPVYDRSAIKDPSDVLNTMWNQMKELKIESLPLNLPTNKVRATYILRWEDIQKLKILVQSNRPNLNHLSSFTISSAYVWSSLAKSAALSGEVVDDDEPEYLSFVADARNRAIPPVPAAYFGNCVGLATTESTHSVLKGEQGFLVAAELIGELIKQKVNKEGELLKDADEWVGKFSALIAKRVFGVAGSPRFDLYDTDFSWGKPIKYEAVAIDGDGSMSLCKSREFEGGLEIGVSLPIKKMEAFAAVFPSMLN